MKKQTWIGLSILLLVIGILAYTRSAANRPAANDDPAPLETNATAPSPASAETPQQPDPPRNQVNAGHPFADTSMLKPPAGAKVAIYEFEDMECPACAYAFPIVHAAAAHYKVPLVRHDYPWSFHPWSFDAAVTARYIQDKVSPQLADDFRRDVFAGQARIANKDDLAGFTRTWFQSHQLTLPFVMDASGSCRTEVESDRALGDRLGVASTPCIFVVTRTRWIAVPFANIQQLDQIVGDALAGTDSSAAAALPSHPESGLRAAALRSAPAWS